MTSFGRCRIGFGALLLGACAVLIGCGGGGGGTIIEPPPVQPPTTQPPPVQPAPVAPSITSQPANQSVTAGASATFTVVATGDAPLSYQWLRGGADVPDASSSTFTVTNAQTVDNGTVWNARVSNAAGQAVSQGATLTVLPGQPRGTITLVAGSLNVTPSGQGTSDGIGAAARFRSPGALTLDAAGNLYAVDSLSHTIRKISPAGDVTTFAGVAGAAGFVDGTGNAARFNIPLGIATGHDGLLYVIDGWELLPLSLAWHAIRRVSPQGEVNTFIAYGVAVRTPGIGLDDAGNLYLTSLSERIARIGPDKTYTTLTAVENGSLQGLTASHDGTVYYTLGNSLRKLTAAGVVTTIAGDVTERGSADGTGAQARFDFLAKAQPIIGDGGGAIVVDSAGNLYVTDSANQTVRKVTPLGVVTTIAGNPGVAGIQLGSLPGGLFSPTGLALLDDKTLFVSSGNAVLKISLP